MLTKQELGKIRQRFKAAGADRPLRLEGNHLEDEELGVVDLGWNVLSAEGHGLKFKDGEFPVSYASNTTFEAATYLVHLPVDIPRMLEDLERFHLLLAGILEGDEEAREIAKRLVLERVKEERENES